MHHGGGGGGLGETSYRYAVYFVHVALKNNKKTLNLDIDIGAKRNEHQKRQNHNAPEDVS